MTTKSIIAGIDATPQGIQAARTATQIAHAAGAHCHLVHAVRDPWVDIHLPVTPRDIDERRRMVLDASRAALLAAVGTRIDAEALEHLEVRFGPAALALTRAAIARDAALVVVGGNRHATAGRWFAGSTAHHLVRMLDHPLLVVAGDSGDAGFRRILAAVDLSSAAGPVLKGAQWLAGLFGSQLCGLHAAHPVPRLPGLPLPANETILAETQQTLQHSIWSQVKYPNANFMLRLGSAVDTITTVAEEWQPDVIVVGTHGRGWLDRLIIGSVTERLLQQLPSSLLVMPVPGPTTYGARMEEEATAARV